MTTKISRRDVLGWALVAMGVSTAVAAPGADAQQRGSDPEHTLDLTWDRWLDHDEIGARMQLMERTWPGLLGLQSIGSSYEGREMWLMTINNPATGPEDGKAAMFIEANVHGNEIQGAEVILYTIWYLMENYGRIDDVTKLVDERVFYLLPSVNPDGRDYFLDEHGSGARSPVSCSPGHSSLSLLRLPAVMRRWSASLLQRNRTIRRGCVRQGIPVFPSGVCCYCIRVVLGLLPYALIAADRECYRLACWQR